MRANPALDPKAIRRYDEAFQNNKTVSKNTEEGGHSKRLIIVCVNVIRTRRKVNISEQTFWEMGGVIAFEAILRVLSGYRTLRVQ